MCIEDAHANRIAVHNEIAIVAREIPVQGTTFEARKVKIGREDDDQVEIVSGLEAGETVAVANTFILKAELGKSEAEHAH